MYNGPPSWYNNISKKELSMGTVHSEVIMSLPLFDANAKCPKCRSGEVKALYRRNREYCDRHSACMGMGHAGKYDPFPHIERTCQRCYYSWPERGMDTEPEPPTTAQIVEDLQKKIEKTRYE